MDLLFPISARISSATWTLVSNSAAARSVFTGAVRTLDRTGDRWRVAVTTENANNDREDYPVRAALKALRANARGQTNRIWFCDTSYRQRGSFPSTELFVNNKFDSDTSNWTVSTEGTPTVSDRILRIAVNTSISDVDLYQSVLLTQYFPYVIRGFILDGQASAGLNIGPSVGSGFQISGYSTQRGMRTVSVVSASSTPSNQFPVVMLNPSQGAFISVPYTSLARCALVDNGPNLLLRSNSFATSPWSLNGINSSNNGTSAPDGSLTAQYIQENSSSNIEHYTGQPLSCSSDAADFSLSVFVKSSSRSWSIVRLYDNSSGTHAFAFFNASTGTFGTFGAGGQWSNARVAKTDHGGGWYRISLTTRKAIGATSILAIIQSSTADTVFSYAGTTSVVPILIWHASLSISSVPVRDSLTTSTSTVGTSQTGSSLYIKGLPASTNGLLLQGDRVQVGTQLNEVVAPLNSDSSGLGYLQCAIPWRSSPSDNDPVIIHQPMGRFILTGAEGGWDDRPGIFSTFSFEMEEALDL